MILRSLSQSERLQATLQDLSQVNIARSVLHNMRKRKKSSKSGKQCCDQPVKNSLYGYIVGDTNRKARRYFHSFLTVSVVAMMLYFY